MCAYLWVCTGGVEGDVDIAMGVRWGRCMHTYVCALGVLRGTCTYLWVCTGGVEGDVDIATGVRWGVEVNVLLLCTGITLSHLSTTQYICSCVQEYICV